MKWLVGAGVATLLFWAVILYFAHETLSAGANSTAYCLRGRMADGTGTRHRSIAMNGVRLGTKIRIVGGTGGPGGYRRYVVRDRIGHGTQLDFWVKNCSTATRWGRRNVSYKIGWANP